MASPFLYQPTSRASHCVSQVGAKSFLWGGLTQDFSKSEKETLATEIEIFNFSSETWTKKTTTGTPPIGLYYCACTVVSETVYHFGGRFDQSYYNELHSLNTLTLHWKEHGKQNPADLPMPKSACGFAAYNEKTSGITNLAVFAGYGRPHNSTQAGEYFAQHTKFPGRGWTNEFHLFNLTIGA